MYFSYHNKKNIAKNICYEVLNEKDGRIVVVSPFVIVP